MNIGMLWFNNDPDTPVPDKIKEAVDYYQSKYGKRPNRVYCHPTTPVPEGALQVGTATVQLKHSRSILPCHFWIGISSNGKDVPDD